MGLVDFSLGDVGEVFKDIREAITGEAIVDPNKKAEIELKLQQLEQEMRKAQVEVNKVEASNSNTFIAGWRPFIGWVGGFSIAYVFLLQPFITYIASMFGVNATPPEIDTGMLFNLVLAMLGFGGFRTYEKLRGVQNKH